MKRVVVFALMLLLCAAPEQAWAQRASSRTPAAAKLRPAGSTSRPTASKFRAPTQWRPAAASKLFATSRTQRIEHDRGSTKFLAPRSDVNLEIQKIAEQRGQTGKLLFVIFAGGAGANTPKAVAERTRAIARAYAQAYKKGLFGKYTLVVASGAAPGLPDIAVEEFRAIAPEIVTVGYGPTLSPKEHIKSGAPYKNLDVVVLTEPTPHVSEATAADPDYMGREIRMINAQGAPALLVTLGGRFGTASEAAMALDGGKAVAFARGTGGISDTFDNVVTQSTKAGKPPRAPVIVSPNFEKARPGTLNQFAQKFADASVTQTLKRLEAGEMTGHTEQGSGTATKLDRIHRVRAPRN